jgi:hypothetical protein
LGSANWSSYLPCVLWYVYQELLLWQPFGWIAPTDIQIAQEIQKISASVDGSQNETQGWMSMLGLDFETQEIAVT